MNVSWYACASRIPPRDPTHYLELQQYYNTSFVVMQGALWLCIAYRFSRASSLRRFLSAVDLGRRPSLIGWFVAWAVIALECITARLTIGRWTWRHSSEAFLLVLLPALSATYEEIVTRGFLYRAFRRSYGPFLSTSVIVGFSGILHMFAFNSAISVVGFVIAWILFCLVREYSLSLWDCVLGHAVNNAVAKGDWVLCWAEMSLFLLFCHWPRERFAFFRHFTTSASAREKSAPAMRCVRCRVVLSDSVHICPDCGWSQPHYHDA
jgi:membrane protease YdiL (CAAX protease family)